MRRSITGMAVTLVIILAAATAVALTAVSEERDEPAVQESGIRPTYVYKPLKADIKQATEISLLETETEPDTTAENSITAAVTVPISVSIAKDEEPYIEVASVPGGTRTSLGVFTVTAYCNCPKCCGKWSGHKMSIPTQAGMPYPVEGYTISVDPKVIPLKSVVELEGYGTRYAHDTGSGIKGKRIDMFFNSHEEALIFGKQKLEVWIYG